jgi:adenosyl cobinamide kinase/adenosyl cobinamide phosphate guanylyltransferase
MAQNEEKPQVVKDIWKAILEDDWMWIVVWGKPRSGKSTIQMSLGYEVYKDWDQVLQSLVYNLAGILYKMDNGIPCRIMTRNKFHNRVPVLLADDFGAQGNKAKTQHELAWDTFKGMFDTLATKIAVIIASMGMPTSLTQQLAEKYTHEIYVPSKGVAKYDRVDWQQNFAGWQPKQNKDWIQIFDFEPVPIDVYKQYDEFRMSLVDELEQLVKDSMAESQILSTIKRMQQIDFDFLELLHSKGTVTNDWINEEENRKYKDALMRCKARSLAVPLKRGSSYHYDITDFGLEVLNTIHTTPTLKDQLIIPVKA